MLIAMAEKKAILNLRVDPEVLKNFKIAAKLRGASMSGLIHQYIVRTIREEKADSPQAFGKLAPVVASIGPGEKEQNPRRFQEEIVPVHDDGVIGKRAAKRKAR